MQVSSASRCLSTGNFTVIAAAAGRLALRYQSIHTLLDACNYLMKKFFLSACLLTATTFSLLSAVGAQAATVTDNGNLRDSDSALFDVFNSTVNFEGLALDETALPELFADSLRWDGIADDIDVFFINEGAGYRNQLSFSLNGGDSNMLFNDIAAVDSIMSDSNGPLSVGDGKSIGGLMGDVNIDFLLKANGAQDAYGNVYGADANANADGLQHVIAREFQQGSDNWVLLGFEDLYGVHTSLGGHSDRDFNDVVVAVRGVTGDRVNPPTEVPEPMTTAGLLVVGALGLAKTRRQSEAS